MTSADLEPFDFLVRKDDLRTTAFRSIPCADRTRLDDGDVLLRVDCFGFTANNVTYAVFGDMMQYWEFFPAEEGWGRVPVWGFATVARSRHPEIAVGERVYGYLPMSSHFVIRAGHVNAGSWVDISPHRQARDAFYNTYLRTSADRGYDPAREAEQMLLRPLFFTGFLIDDFLADSGFFGARSVVVSSASSKTAIGLAFQLFQRGEATCKVNALTSNKNLAFVERLGLHHRVLPYHAIETLDPAVPTVFVDMAGNGDVAARVHRHFTDALRYSCQVGATHWERLGLGAALPGPRPELFWAPGRLAKRMEDWGLEGFHARAGAAWSAFVTSVDSWLTKEIGHGRQAVLDTYMETLEGRADPGKGHVLFPA